MKMMMGALSVCLVMGMGAAAGSVNVAVERIADMKANGSGDRVIKTVDANRILGYHSKAGNMQLVYVLKMTGAADASKIAAANFNVTQVSTAAGFMVDAKVIRTSANAKVLATDYQTKAVMLMDNFSDNSAKGAKTLDAAGQSALVTYLKANWIEGGYLFLGLQTDPMTIVSTKNIFAKFAADGVLTITLAP